MENCSNPVKLRLRYATYFGYAVCMGLTTISMIAVFYCSDLIGSGHRVLPFITFYGLPVLVFFASSLTMRWLFVRVGLMTRDEAKNFPLRRDSKWPTEWQDDSGKRSSRRSRDD